MTTWCNACKQEGYIAPRGRRHPSTGPNGQQWALSGDINMCGCSPPPVFYAERNVAQVFTSDEGAALTNTTHALASHSGPSHYDEQYTLTRHDGRVLAGVRYRVRDGSNIVASGVTDANGKTQRVTTDSSQRLRLDVAR